MDFQNLPLATLRKIKRPPQVAYALGLGRFIGRLVLLLTTTGRKTGLPRVTPLQYEEIDGMIYIGSARGQQADWYKNILANPRVQVRVKNRRFAGLAETSTNPERIADFLQLRLQRHPRMIAAMFRMEGLPAKPNRADLLAYAGHLALVTIKPLAETGSESAQAS
jgi:deazaflavin-dependent oxidoreductase (nitroreductase family)